jgi:hypothetical protein
MERQKHYYALDTLWGAGGGGVAREKHASMSIILPPCFQRLILKGKCSFAVSNRQSVRTSGCSCMHVYVHSALYVCTYSFHANSSHVHVFFLKKKTQGTCVCRCAHVRGSNGAVLADVVATAASHIYLHLCSLDRRPLPWKQYLPLYNIVIDGWCWFVSREKYY